MSILTIPNDTSYIPMLQSFVSHSARLAKLDEKFLPRLQLVCEEAFVYVLKNSFEENEDALVKIETNLKNYHFTLSFFDEGLPFDLSLSKDYKVDDFSTDGLELFLIKKYTDKVEWVNHGNKGKEFRLSFDIPSQDIFSIDKNKKEKNSVSTPKVQDIEIRTFKESDAIKISRIIYRAYGYTYPNEDLYYPQKILDLNKSGELISIVSYDKKSKEIVGHYALERSTLGAVAECGQAVVSPKCRGMGLMTKMRKLLEQSAYDLGLEGIISQPVTSHTFSQHVNEDFGSSVCGFSFGFVPQKISFKQINQTLSQRESCILYFKLLKSRERTLYIPKHYENIIDKIYKNIALDYTKSYKKNTTENGIVTSNYSSNWGVGVIDVKKIGKNNFTQIKKAFYSLLFNLKAEVIFLNITLEDSNIDDLIKDITKEKFFFSGVHPSMLDAKDVIRFEYLNVTIDETKIKIYSKNAKEIFDYITKQKKEVLS